MAVTKKTPVKRASAAAKNVVSKVEKVEAKAESILEKIEDEIETVVEEVKAEVEKVENTFESWWDKVATALFRQGHSDKNVLISASEQNGGNYTAFVKEAYGKAIEDHGTDIKKIAKVAFDHIPAKK